MFKKINIRVSAVKTTKIIILYSVQWKKVLINKLILIYIFLFFIFAHFLLLMRLFLLAPGCYALPRGNTTAGATYDYAQVLRHPDNKYSARKHIVLCLFLELFDIPGPNRLIQYSTVRVYLSKVNLRTLYILYETRPYILYCTWTFYGVADVIIIFRLHCIL